MRFFRAVLLALPLGLALPLPDGTDGSSTGDNDNTITVDRGTAAGAQGLSFLLGGGLWWAVDRHLGKKGRSQSQMPTGGSTSNPAQKVTGTMSGDLLGLVVA